MVLSPDDPNFDEKLFEESSETPVEMSANPKDDQ